MNFVSTRSLRLTHELTASYLAKLQEQMRYLAALNPQPVTLFINSGGGDTQSALKFCHFLRNFPLTVVSHIEVQASSAAGLIAISCKLRKMCKNAVLELHSTDWTIPVVKFPSSGIIPSAVVKTASRLQEESEALIHDCSRFSLEVIKHFMHTPGGRNFTAGEARLYRLIDFVVE